MRHSPSRRQSNTQLKPESSLNADLKSANRWEQLQDSINVFSQCSEFTENWNPPNTMLILTTWAEQRTAPHLLPQSRQKASGPPCLTGERGEGGTRGPPHIFILEAAMPRLLPCLCHEKLEATKTKVMSPPFSAVLQ